MARRSRLTSCSSSRFRRSSSRSASRARRSASRSSSRCRPSSSRWSSATRRSRSLSSASSCCSCSERSFVWASRLSSRLASCSASRSSSAARRSSLHGPVVQRVVALVDSCDPRLELRGGGLELLAMGVERVLVDAELRLARVVVGLELLQLDLALFLPRGDLVDLRAPLCERALASSPSIVLSIFALDGVDVLFWRPPGLLRRLRGRGGGALLGGGLLFELRAQAAAEPLLDLFDRAVAGADRWFVAGSRAAHVVAHERDRRGDGGRSIPRARDGRSRVRRRPRSSCLSGRSGPSRRPETGRAARPASAAASPSPSSRPRAL